MSSTLVRLRDKLGSDSEYFTQVYNYTFEFSRPPGQRSLGMYQIVCLVMGSAIYLAVPALDMAQGFWSLLVPHGLQGGALSHLARGTGSDDEDDEDDAMMGVDEEGWKEDYTQWWFEYLTEKGGKGVSKDTWQMVRTIPCCSL